MPKQSLIYMDATGYPKRAAKVEAACVKAGVDFNYFTPKDAAVTGARQVSIPLEWLPEDAANGRINHYEWFRMHLHMVVATDLLPESDFYWMIEADVDGVPSAFERLLTQTAMLPDDGLWPRLFYREQEPEMPAFSQKPDWCQVASFNCMMRASRAALEVWRETAVETREIFTEVASASVLHRAGLQIGRINRPDKPSLYHTGTLRFNPGRTNITPCISSTMLRHPVKSDDP